MGYYTGFKVKFDGGDKHEEIIEQINLTSGYDGSWYAYNDAKHIRLDEVKWYDHKDHMRMISAAFPDVLFEIEGEGEEADDIWKAYTKDGKYVRYNAIISFPEFNEDDLQ